MVKAENTKPPKLACEVRGHSSFRTLLPHQQTMEGDESPLRKALEAIPNGLPGGKAARYFKVPRSTPSDRRTGCHKHWGCRVVGLSTRRLADMLPSHKHAREMGFHMLKASTSSMVRPFGKPVESSRIRCTQTERISKFHEYFEIIRSRTDVHRALTCRWLTRQSAILPLHKRWPKQTACWFQM